MAASEIYEPKLTLVLSSLEKNLNETSRKPQEKCAGTGIFVGVILMDLL